MKKILITGASGFVGSHLVEEALGRDLDVYAGIRRSSSKEYLQDERINFVEMNFGDKGQMSNLMRRKEFDYVIHNAGVVAAPKLSDYMRVNFDYTKNFVEAIEASGEQLEKFTYISSAASYGPVPTKDLTDFLKEDDPRRPINTYGEAKLASEQFLASLPEFPYVIMRPTGVYGPREKEILTYFKLINRHVEGYIGFRRQHLAFVYVKDLARVVLDATTASEVSRKSYFISDGRYYSQQDIGRTARQILGKKTLRFNIPVTLIRSIAWMMEQAGKATGNYPPLNLEKVRILESLNWKCDIEPLKEDLNFQPQYDLEDGLIETLAWYKEQGWL
ncbi:MAG: NAD(P)-dependent oxidoreductase [Saprospiraceae bacterium]|nr:NAD(P)-dependent oxidoreductase [Saprospiraceae bacterium]MCF8249410.1 NAD(P)-dependent oxidoreductase [Saprospiraceae bacterium]MCF8279064.1 NAD(P)-dependent oxidoreductase [Bacteroidales bacterium]MCF8311539.1 NAD(P)-dependent oxidoreductase [Saprospiraceae bacterium]MCF8440029.1 NAD(P)-dependent oxidoreductase [Saprospiraceae bacterium]